MFKFIKKNRHKHKKYSAESILELASKKTNVPIDELKNKWLNEYLMATEDATISEFNTKLDEIKQKHRENARYILLDAFSRLDYEFFRDEFIIKVPCKNAETKSRLIGLNGRNKKAFERTCGVELIINDKDEFVTLSSANHIKRELAYLVLNKLLDTKNIEPNKITNYYSEAKNQFENQLFQTGKDVIERILKLKNINQGLYPYIGKLKYRYSFGQNILEHSIEAAYVAELLAQELGVDTKLAKMCAFFHDLGKSVDHETENDHIQQGVKLAEQYGLPSEVIQAIQTHHDELIISNIYDSITKIADRSSASKPGARKNSKDDFFRRAKVYEDICYSFKEVENCYVLKSGFLIKVIVKPNLIKDDNVPVLANLIKQKLQQHPETKNYVVNLELIRESSYKIKTNKYLNE